MTADNLLAVQIKNEKFFNEARIWFYIISVKVFPALWM